MKQFLVISPLNGLCLDVAEEKTIWSYSPRPMLASAKLFSSQLEALVALDIAGSEHPFLSFVPVSSAASRLSEAECVLMGIPPWLGGGEPATPEIRFRALAHALKNKRISTEQFQALIQGLFSQTALLNLLEVLALHPQRAAHPESEYPLF